MYFYAIYSVCLLDNPALLMGVKSCCQSFLNSATARNGHTYFQEHSLCFCSVSSFVIMALVHVYVSIEVDILYLEAEMKFIFFILQLFSMI